MIFRRQRHCPKFAFSSRAHKSQWKRRRRLTTKLSLLDSRQHLLLLLLLPLIISTDATKNNNNNGRTEEGKDALIRPDIQLEPIDAATEAQLLLEEAMINFGEAEGGMDNDRLEKFDKKKSDGKSVGRVDAAPFVHWHYSSAFGRHSNEFFFIGAPSVQALVSRHSWERYQRFKENTCRKGVETDLAERRLNSTESPYFHWEENEFHRELRKKLLPQTTREGRTSFRALLNSELLGSLDPRLFVSTPKSQCKATRLVDEADERLKQIKEEKHMFEDFLINKVLDPSLFAIPTKSNRRTNGTSSSRKSNDEKS